MSETFDALHKALTAAAHDDPDGRPASETDRIMIPPPGGAPERIPISPSADTHSTATAAPRRPPSRDDSSLEQNRPSTPPE